MIRQILKLIPERKRNKLYKLVGETLTNPFPTKNMFKHIQLIKKIGFEPEFIIDVGSYIGGWTKEAIKMYPEAKFLMVEAQESKFDILNSFASSFENVIFCNALLGDSKKENIKFFDMETGSSIYEENTDYERNIKYLNMTTLDTLVSENKLSGRGFIKLDVQGAEIDVLKGAKETLKMAEFILLEASILNYNEKAPLIAEVIEFLNNEQYWLFDICDEKRTKEGILFQVDLIFVKSQSEYRKKINFTNLNK